MQKPAANRELPRGALSQTDPVDCPGKYQASLNSATYTPDGKTFVAIYQDLERERTVLRVWDVATGRLKKELSLGRGRHVGKLSPDGQYFTHFQFGAPADQGGEKVVRISDGRIVARFPGVGDDRGREFVTPTGNYLVLHENGDVQQYSLITGKPVPPLEKTFIALRSDAVFSADGKRVAIMGHGPMRPGWQSSYASIHVFDLKTGKSINEFFRPNEGTNVKPGEKPGMSNPGYYHLALSPDGKTLAASGTHEVQIYDVDSGKLRAEIPRTDLSQAFADLAFSPDGAVLAISSGLYDQTGSIRYYDPTTMRLLGSVATPTERPEMLRFSPDGSTVASYGGGEDDCRIVFWKHPGGRTKFSPDDFREHWEALATGTDARAYQAEIALSDPRSLPQLDVALRPQRGSALTAKEKKMALDDLSVLGAPRYRVREDATQRLSAKIADPEVGPWYLKQVQSRVPERVNPSNAEIDLRLRAILAVAQRTPQGKPQPATLQIVRALDVLSRMGTPEARKVIERIARDGSPDRISTKKAKQVLRDFTVFAPIGGRSSRIPGMSFPELTTDLGPFRPFPEATPKRLDEARGVLR